ncbi:MAG: 50S ribosomal protein L24 [Lentisphaeria bacterium]
MAKANFKKGDVVYVIAGDDKGKSGKVLRVNRKEDLAYVEGLNLQKKTYRRSQDRPQGGIDDIEGPIHASNLMVSDRYAAKHQVKKSDKEK